MAMMGPLGDDGDDGGVADGDESKFGVFVVMS